MNTDNLVGTTLGGRYDVIEKIGTGGMATVFKAKDTLLNRYVAIKLLRDNLEGEEQIVSNFIKEAQASASLSHNNVVSVYDVCEDQGINYMVMELVDGITLKDYIKKNGALPWQEACDYALQIAQGIGEAHSKNIIHRDIKPQNVIMTEDKTLKVTDFGIARAMESDTTIVGGTALGSVHYISPEQARGGFTDARSDIYSLGIVMYEMLTGKVPFDGDTPVSVALMHLEKEPVNVKCLNMDIPADLAYVVMKAISKEQSARYQNVNEMIDDLHAVLADEPLPSKDDGVHAADAEYDDYDDSKIYDDDNNEEDDEPEYDGSHKRTKKRKKVRKKKTAAQKKEDRLAVILALGTVLALILIVLGGYKIYTGTKRSTVPNLANMTIEEATQKLQSIDLRVDDEIEYSFSDEIEDGKVITQDPDKGTSVPKNSTVKLIVSIGSSGGSIAVPNTVNKSFDDAIAQIMAVGLTYRVIEENSDTVVQGNIIRQIPIAGTKVNKDDIVTLHVSTGKGVTATQAPATVQKVEVPNVIGMGREQAEIALSERGLRLGTVTRKLSDAPAGTIISQSPDSSRTAAKDSYVTIIVSAGNEVENIDGSQNEQENNGSSENTEEPSQNENKSDNNTEQAESTSVPEGSMGESASEETSSKLFSVKIPSSANDNVNVEIIANGQTIHSGVHSKSEGVVSVEITGSGVVDVQALIDGALAAHKKIDFSK